ncbi:hypothetical protein ACFX15_011299 [Malus domestica]
MRRRCFPNLDDPAAYYCRCYYSRHLPATPTGPGLAVNKKKKKKKGAGVHQTPGERRQLHRFACSSTDHPPSLRHPVRRDIGDVEDSAVLELQGLKPLKLNGC